MSNLLQSVKTYFNINDTSKDSVIQLIIDNDIDLAGSLGISDALVFSMVIYDVGQWLKSGQSSFQQATASDITHYPDDIYRLILLSMSVKVY